MKLSSSFKTRAGSKTLEIRMYKMTQLIVLKGNPGPTQVSTLHISRLLVRTCFIISIHVLFLNLMLHILQGVREIAAKIGQTS